MWASKLMFVAVAVLYSESGRAAMQPIKCTSARREPSSGAQQSMLTEASSLVNC